MEKKQFKRSEISKLQKWKWIVEDLAGLYIIKFVATLSRDPEVKELYQEMRKALLEEGDQPKAVQITDEIAAKIMTNTMERAGL